jgi:hypothetical protein
MAVFCAASPRCVKSTLWHVPEPRRRACFTATTPIAVALGVPPNDATYFSLAILSGRAGFRLPTSLAARGFTGYRTVHVAGGDRGGAAAVGGVRQRGRRAIAIRDATAGAPIRLIGRRAAHGQQQQPDTNQRAGTDTEGGHGWALHRCGCLVRQPFRAGQVRLESLTYVGVRASS